MERGKEIAKEGERGVYCHVEMGVLTRCSLMTVLIED